MLGLKFNRLSKRYPRARCITRNLSAIGIDFDNIQMFFSFQDISSTPAFQCHGLVEYENVFQGFYKELSM